MWRLKLVTGGIFAALYVLPALVLGQSIVIASGNGQLVCDACTASGGAFTPLVVQVFDSSDRPEAGVAVTWTLTQQNTGPETTTTVTNSSGEAIYTVPSLVLPGSGWVPFAVVASALGASVTFVETVAVPENGGLPPVFASLSSGTAPNLTGSDGETSTEPISVTVSAPGGPVAGVSVMLRATGGPTVSCATQMGAEPGAQPGTVLTNASGVATCNPLFGGAIGTGTYTIVVGGGFATFGPANLTVSPGVPAVIKYISGNNQSVVPGSETPLPLTAEITDLGGNPSAGASVKWTVTSGTASLTSIVMVSDSNGRVSARVTPTAGPVQVTISLASNSAVQYIFTVNVIRVVTALQMVSGNNQQANPNTPFPNPLIVQVDDNAAPVPNVTVSFAVTSGSATLSALTVVTNVQGQAQVIVTTGPTLGPVTITASLVSAGKTYIQTFSLTVGPPVPVQIASVVNAASLALGLVPGGRVTIFGTGLAPQGPVAGPSSGPLPLTLGGVTVTFTSANSSIQAPIFSISVRTASHR